MRPVCVCPTGSATYQLPPAFWSGQSWIQVFSPLIEAGRREAERRRCLGCFVYVCVCTCVYIVCVAGNPLHVVASELNLHVCKYDWVSVGCVLFATVHPLNVLLVVRFECLAFQFECVCDQAGLRCPGLGTQADLLRDLEPFQFCCWGQTRFNLRVIRYEQ